MKHTNSDSSTRTPEQIIRDCDRRIKASEAKINFWFGVAITGLALLFVLEMTRLVRAFNQISSGTEAEQMMQERHIHKRSQPQ